jgi:hypothetical protein
MKLSSLFSVILLFFLLIGILPFLGNINKMVIVFSIIAYIFANFELHNSKNKEDMKIIFRNILSLILIFSIAVLRDWIGNVFIN